MVTLVNKLTVTGDVEVFHRITAGLTEFMRSQPGYIRSQLLRSVRDENVYIEIAEWEEVQAHQRAVRSEGFRERVRGLGDVASVDPGLYETVRDETAAVRG
jgi:heme-degrading monooxygenase HmoA